MSNRVSQNQTRPRSSRRQSAQPQKKDAVFSVMLAQITVCLILLALAYSLKVSGLPLYGQLKTAVSQLLTQEWNISEVMAQYAKVPVWLAGVQSAEPVQQPAPQVPEPEQQPVIDDELAGYIEQYLPEEITQPDPASAPLPEKDAAGGGRGGGINPVQFVGAKKTLGAPKGAMLSPFFITDKPILPVKVGTLTCGFGFRVHPVTGKSDFHTGVDIAAPEGAPISAVLSGVVSEVGESSIYGNYIVLRHGNGLETAYCHCSEILAPKGAVIRKREVIAKVGSTGMSTGSHVHLEFRVGGLQANPAWVYDEF